MSLSKRKSQKLIAKLRRIVGKKLSFFQITKSLLSKFDISGFIVSVDEVERLTGLDFNNLLDNTGKDDIEDDIEAMW